MALPVVLVPGCDGTGSDQERHSPNRCMRTWWVLISHEGTFIALKMDGLSHLCLYSRSAAISYDSIIKWFCHAATPSYIRVHTQLFPSLLESKHSAERWRNAQQTGWLTQLDCFMPNYISQEESLKQGWDALINIAISNSEITSGHSSLFSTSEKNSL